MDLTEEDFFETDDKFDFMDDHATNLLSGLLASLQC